MMRTVFLILIAALILSSCGVRQEKVDLIIHNGNIQVMDMRFSKAEAMAVHDGKVVEAGSEREIMNRYQAHETRDLRKNYVYPGFSAVIRVGEGEAFDLSELKNFAARGVTYLQMRGGDTERAIERAGRLNGRKDLEVTLYPAAPPPDALENSDLDFSAINGFTVSPDYPDYTGKEDFLRLMRFAAEHRLRIVMSGLGSDRGDTLQTAAAEHLQGVNDQRWSADASKVKKETVAFFGDFTVLPEVNGDESLLLELLNQNGMLILKGRDPLQAVHNTISNGLTEKQAVKAVTAWPALSEFRGEHTGMLKDGFQADFMITDKPISQSTGDEVQVISTYKRGEIVYEQD